MAKLPTMEYRLVFEPVEADETDEPCKCQCCQEADEPKEGGSRLTAEEQFAVSWNGYLNDRTEEFRERMSAALEFCYINRAESIYLTPGHDASIMATSDLTPSDTSLAPSETSLSITLSRKWSTADDLMRDMDTLLSMIAGKFTSARDSLECCMADAGCNGEASDQTEG